MEERGMICYMSMLDLYLSFIPALVMNWFSALLCDTLFFFIFSQLVPLEL